MQAIGIDIGGTTIKGGRVDESGDLVESFSQPNDAQDLPALLVIIRSVAERLSRKTQTASVGLGIPGLRSSDTGVIEFSPNLPYLNGVNLEALLAEQLRSPLIARNDADMSAWGEFLAGAGVGTTEMACLTLGTGVGSGLILRGELYSGHRGYAAEAGHMIVETDGLPCPCGGRGCLETVASATGIVSLARRRMQDGVSTSLTAIDEPLTAKAIYEAALWGDEVSSQVFVEAGRYLGIACVNLINVLNLEMIVIGGGVSEAGALLLEGVRAEAKVRAYKHTFEACRIVTAKLGNNAGVIGGALLALRRLR